MKKLKWEFLVKALIFFFKVSAFKALKRALIVKLIFELSKFCSILFEI